MTNNVGYIYSLDKRLEHSVPGRLLACSLEDSGIIRKVHKNLCNRIRNEGLLFNYERPRLITRRGQQTIDEYGRPSELPRLRLVYYCYRDVAEYPTFVRRLQDVRVTSGRTTSMAVELSGFPVPDVKWFKDGVPLKETDNLEVIKYGHQVYALWIRNAVPSDSGWYQCSATNAAGTIRSTAQVRVEPYNEYRPVRRRNLERIGFTFRQIISK